MKNVWPPQLNYPLTDPATAATFDRYWLWPHEYNKHGKDYVNILQILYPNLFKNASSKDLQIQFFTDTVNLYNFKFNGLQKIKPFDDSHYSKKSGRKGRDYLISKEDLSALLKIPTSHFLAQCQRDNVLS